MIVLVLAVLLAVAFSVKSYVDGLPKLRYRFSVTTQSSMVPYPDARFAVLDGVRLYSAALGASGNAFLQSETRDCALYGLSPALLNRAVDEILRSNVQFVLVPGGLTKSGELLCHREAASALARLTAQGIRVYTLPGSGDIGNPRACGYDGGQTVPAPSATAAQFRKLYAPFGPGDAVSRGPDSLSYVAEPVQGLWLLCLDACRYGDGRYHAGGRVSQAQQRWIEDVLMDANRKGKAVMAMCFYGLGEHWQGEAQLRRDDLLPDCRHESALLASYGVRLCFTGASGGQDIALADYGLDGYLYDISTGPLVTPMCPLRVCSLRNGVLSVQSESVAGLLSADGDSAEKLLAFRHTALTDDFSGFLRRFFVPSRDADLLSSAAASSWEAFIDGDENAAKKPAVDFQALGFYGRLIDSAAGGTFDRLWKDAAPGDNNLTLPLGAQSGS